VVRGTEAEFFCAHPSTAELVVEVAVSSPVLDRENAALCAEAGVNEYWIVLGPTRQIEVYRQPEAGRYREVRVLALEDSIECACVPGIQLKVAGLFTHEQEGSKRGLSA